MLNILSIDEGEEWFEPVLPQYGPPTQFSSLFRFHNLNGLIRNVMFDGPPGRVEGGKITFAPIGKLIGA